MKRGTLSDAEVSVVIGLIGLLLVVYWIGSEFGESAGVIGIVVLLVLLGGMFLSGWKKGDRAVRNWTEYWSEGGPVRRR